MLSLLLAAALAGPPVPQTPTQLVPAHRTVELWAPPRDQPTTFPRALVWAVVPKMWDYYWTAECIEKVVGCSEGNQLQRTAEHRVTLGMAVSVVAAEGFYYMESEKGLRLWPLQTRVRSKIPRYVWAVANVALGFYNASQVWKD